MKKSVYHVISFSILCCLFPLSYIYACTSVLVSKGATADGSAMITYECDGEFHPILQYEPAADYQPGDSVELGNWDDDKVYKIPRPKHTYAVLGLMNEHQLAIGESTFDGRMELRNPEGHLRYWHLMHLALRRAKTAREAIKVMTSLVDEYGYASTGESFSIADPNEVWIMEMIGPGEGGKGAVWAALKIPDGYICAHANKSVIGEFPLKDPENCLYSRNVISLAVKKGYYDPKSGKPFSFHDAYDPDTPQNLKFCSTRVWSIFNRAAPSLKLSPDYHRALPGAEPYPMWVKPDKKLATADVFSLIRDHYEGTDFDMTKGIDAGPYGSPNRWRPLVFEVDSTDYSWERPISTQQTGYSFVSQSRSWLPDAIGGIFWYGLDDTYTNCYTPLYVGINEAPESYRTGSLSEFSWKSGWWVFNFVANFANLKYSYMIKDIQKVQNEIESRFFLAQSKIEKTALELSENDPPEMIRFLTKYSVTQAESTIDSWRRLGKLLITKYNDGFVQETPGDAVEKGYPDQWLQEVVRGRPDQFKMRKRDASVPESKLTD